MLGYGGTIKGQIRLQTLGRVRTVQAAVEDVRLVCRHDQTVGGVSMGIFHVNFL